MGNIWEVGEPVVKMTKSNEWNTLLRLEKETLQIQGLILPKKKKLR